jgi:hypothetical protein
MKKRSRRKSAATGKRSNLSLQNLIILLLAVLIILTGANLYLDHFSTDKAQPVQKNAASSKTGGKAAQPGNNAKNEGKTANADMVGLPLSKPGEVPPLTADMPEPKNIRIQLLNGCGVPGLATRARTALRAQNYDILTFGNAQAQDYSKTQIIVRDTTPKSELAARRLANSLGLSSDQITTNVDPNLVDLDVTLIVGSDYKKLNLILE